MNLFVRLKTNLRLANFETVFVPCLMDCLGGKLSVGLFV